MPGEHQRHHLVADLGVAEAGPVLVAGGDQQAEDVQPLVVGVRPAPGDLAEDDLVEDGARAHHPPPGAPRAAHDPHGGVGAVEAEGDLEVVGGVGAVPALIGVESEQGPHGDPHREVAHPLVDVHDLAVAPAGHRPRPPPPPSSRARPGSAREWKAGIMIRRARSW